MGIEGGEVTKGIIVCMACKPVAATLTSACRAGQRPSFDHLLL